MDFEEFMSYDFPKMQNGYETLYHVLFEKIDEAKIKQYIDEVKEKDPITLWRMMYCDLVGNGRFCYK